jgi:glycerol-3-phosphate O-acyltransferase
VIGVQKLAFEVCYLINEITPATTISLALLSLLCRTAATRDQIHSDVAALKLYLTKRQSSSNFVQPSQPIPDDVDAAIAVLLANGIMQETNNPSDNTDEYSIIPKSFLVAMYYSNMAVHHFVIAAFTELGLINIAHTKSDPIDSAFVAEVLRLRDLFKYEFFFARKDQFPRQFIDELGSMGAPTDPFDAQDREEAKAVLNRQPLMVAYGVLSPFINAYQLFANKLLQHKSNSIEDRTLFIESCQSENGQNEENFLFASKALLTNGYLLAENRDLLKSNEGVAQRREQFSDELQNISNQLLMIRELTQ